MTSPPHLRPIDPLDLPVYPIDPAERLDGHSFVKWNSARWLSSRTYKLMSWENQGMARALFDLCQTESPVGTLPDDDAELAVMLRILDPRRVAEMRGQEFGPLRGWYRVLVGNATRLAHKVVTEQVQDALERRAMARLSEEQRAIAMRLDRLRKAMLKEGLAKAVVADDVLIGRMDAWLQANHKTRRSVAVYRSAILHAAGEKWFSRKDLSG